MFFENLSFPGQYYDEETGLHYYWNRYYDPSTGRYITTDPIGFEGSDINLYRYVQSNPVKFIDPDGQIVQALAAGGVAGLISGAATFASQMMQGACVEDALKAALVSGGTTAFSVGFGALIGPSLGTYFVNSMLTTYVNGALQATVNGKGNSRSALFSGFATTPAAYLASQYLPKGALGGALAGAYAAPLNALGSFFSPPKKCPKKCGEK